MSCLDVGRRLAASCTTPVQPKLSSGHMWIRTSRDARSQLPEQLVDCSGSCGMPVRRCMLAGL